MLHHLALLPRYGRTMSSASDEAPPPFQSKLPDVEKWFRDRQLHYSKRIEDRLIDEGVENLEEMKLFDDWSELLRDEQSPDCYKNIKWRKFEISFAALKEEGFDELKSKQIPIKDTSTGAKRQSEDVSSGQKRQCSGGNNGKVTMDSFYPVKKKKKESTGNSARTTRSEEEDDDDDDDVEIINEELALLRREEENESFLHSKIWSWPKASERLQGEEEADQ